MQKNQKFLDYIVIKKCVVNRVKDYFCSEILPNDKNFADWLGVPEALVKKINYEEVSMAGSFADAFVGAGIVSEKKAALLEKDKKENKKIDKPKIEQVHESQQKHINEEFTKLWNNEKSHKFIVHLIYSYIPSKGNFAWIQEQLKQKICCICKCKLVSKDDLISKSGELAKLTIEHMKLSAKNKLTTEQIQSDISKNR